MTGRDLLGLARSALGSAVMFMAGALVPFIGPFIMILAPMPVLSSAVGLRHAFRRAITITVVSAGLVILGGGLGGGVAYLVTAGVAALSICYMIERRQPFERIVSGATALIVVAGVLSALAYVGSPQALATSLQHDLTLTMTRGEKFYGMAGLNASLTADMRAYVIDLTIRLMPALVVISAALMVVANLALFWRMTGRQQRVGYPLFGDPVRWSSPEWLIWALLATGFGLFIPIKPLRTAALDCFVVLATIYFCQGLAIMAFYFRVLAMPRVARGLIYLIALVQPVLAILVCAAGIFDLWIDFRRLKPSSPQTRNLGDFP